jgi:uncharacterized protein
MILMAGDIQSCCACPRRSYLDLHGDPNLRVAPSEFARKLLRDGRAHERRVLEALDAHRIAFDGSDVDAAVERTRSAMAEGIPRIAGGVLRHDGGDGRPPRLGIADLLERAPGRSRLGRYRYEPVEIRTARRVKAPYRLQVAFYGHLLAGAQGRWPENGHVILGDGQRRSFPFRYLKAHYERVLERLERIYAGEPQPIHVTSRCLQCAWQGVCLPEARRDGHLSLVHGLNRRQVALLEAHGVRSIADLSVLEPGRLGAWIEVACAQAETLVLQARALYTETAVWRARPALPRAEREIYFDIEGDPEHDVFYLFGCLVRDRAGERHRSFLAETPEEEGRVFQACLGYLERYPEAPVYHYHDFELLALRRLAQRHGVLARRVEALRPRFHDLSRVLTASCHLPVASYSLKAVARHLGFQWTRQDSSAVQAVVWFSRWLESGDRSLLDRAVEYNADDCRATCVLKDWLATGPRDGVLAAAPALPWR